MSALLLVMSYILYLLHFLFAAFYIVLTHNFFITQHESSKKHILTPLFFLLIGLIFAHISSRSLFNNSLGAQHGSSLMLIFLMSSLLGMRWAYLRLTRTEALHSGLWIICSFLLYTTQHYHHTWLIQKLGDQELNIRAIILDAQENVTKNRVTFLVKCTEIDQSGRKYLCSFKLFICTEIPAINYSPGNSMYLKNVMITNRPETSLKPVNFSDYLVRQGVLAYCFLTSEQITLYTKQSSFFIAGMHALRKNLHNKITARLSQLASYFFNLIFLGIQSEHEGPSLQNSFLIWGISHYLARSGLHIALLLFAWITILGIVPLHIRYKRILLLIFSSSYYFLSWPSCSFVRALSIFVVTFFGKICNQPTRSIHLLLLLCLFMLLSNPIQLFFLDFQLTFLLTFCLMIAS